MENLEREIFQKTEQASHPFLERGVIKHSVYFNNGDFWWQENKAEKPQKISLSTMIADLSFGIKYVLQNTDLQEARDNFDKYQKEAENYDNQLKQHLEIAQIARDTTTYARSREAYDAIVKRLKKEIQGFSPFDANEFSSIGLIGERLVESILRKVIIDANISLQVLRANPIEDVEGKVDLFLHREEKKRGVEVEPTEIRKASDIGFQLMVASEKNQKITQKENQINKALKKKTNSDSSRLIDIVLVRISPSKIKEAFLNWKKDGRLPGGPARYFNEHERRFIVEKILQPLQTKENFISEEEFKRLNEVKMYALI